MTYSLFHCPIVTLTTKESVLCTHRGLSIVHYNLLCFVNIVFCGDCLYLEPSPRKRVVLIDSSLGIGVLLLFSDIPGRFAHSASGSNSQSLGRQSSGLPLSQIPLPQLSNCQYVMIIYNSTWSIFIQWIMVISVRWQIWPGKYKRRRTSWLLLTLSHKQKKTKERGVEYRFAELCVPSQGAPYQSCFTNAALMRSTLNLV